MTQEKSSPQDTGKPTDSDSNAASQDQPTSVQVTADDTEYGGRKGPDPTRYGDWEKNGRCIDF